MKHEIIFSLRIAGNTQTPALLVLEGKGYSLTVEAHEDESLSWNAVKDGRYFSATDPVELLGLVTLWEVRGEDWQMRVGEPDLCSQLLDEA